MARDPYRKQFRTVEEYAEWLFRTFPVGLRGRSAGIAVPQPDLASFRTVEEADAASSRIDDAIDEAAEEKVAQPGGRPARRAEGVC